MKLLNELYTVNSLKGEDGGRGSSGNLSLRCFVETQVMKTYHMYHAETISAESKLREAERQEERVKGVSGIGGGGEPVFSLRIEERHQRRNAARKMEKMREKVRRSDPLPTEPAQKTGFTFYRVFLQRKAKYSENKLKTLKARNEYLLTLEATNASVFKYYIHDLPDLIDVSRWRSREEENSKPQEGPS